MDSDLINAHAFAYLIRLVLKEILLRNIRLDVDL
ncbi:uncharacterized protein METZ01_LOCUS194804 [marine metagenome]|uniref:Uncharacterized protein n=1 Tax=marine metagenome TaxID=408172 RepID=A0A382DU34_9ZZZZ